MNFILGISAYYHDSAAALLSDGVILAAAQEERFTRIKHDASFPCSAVRSVLDAAGISGGGLSSVVFYDKPFVKLERILETYHVFAPRGLPSFLASAPVWMQEKLFMKQTLRKELAALGIEKIPLYFSEHHCSHGASAFFPSPFREAAILTVDGVGEWATACIGHGLDNSISILKEMRFPHSIGLLYSAATYYAGFKVNSGEYKLMGLAPYALANPGQTDLIREKLLAEIVDIREDGGIFLNMRYFDFATGLTMTDNRRWSRLLGFPPRTPESDLSPEYWALAMATQQITEEILVRLALTAKRLTHASNLVLAGGVALNCVANSRLRREKIFDAMWIQPAAGDAGGALGAALAAWHIREKNPRTVDPHCDGMNGAYLGPAFPDSSITRLREKLGAVFTRYDDFDELCTTIASLIAKGAIVGWFQGRMEFGPRSLGNRSIVGDPRNTDMRRIINQKIKFRESFRPFAPAVLEEDVTEYFNMDFPSPYMLFTAPLTESRKITMDAIDNETTISAMAQRIGSDIPAVTHVDYSARVQTVNQATNPRFWKLLSAFKQLTGCSVLINTSFNIRGEPIVCAPDDAYRCFMSTGMDYLVLGDFLFDKFQQPTFEAGRLTPRIRSLD